MRVYLLDVFCTIPYYMSALCMALRNAGVDAVLGSTSYYQDRQHFRNRDLRPEPGLVDFVAWAPSLDTRLRRPLKLVEGLVNMGALVVRFALRPPDIVHVQYLPLAMRGLGVETAFLEFCRMQGSRLVYTVHDLLPPGTGDRHRQRFHEIYHLVDAVICHSRESKNRVASEFGVDSQRIWVIPHGPLFPPQASADAQAARCRLSLPVDACLVLCQGIIKPYKGISFLLDAWDELPEGPPAVLLLAGTGEEEELRAIGNRVATMRRPDRVRCDFRFVSEQALSDYYDAADILVYPYKEVTTSGALLTGLARGKAIVATKCPAFMELLSLDESAWLVDYGETGQLTGALAELIRDAGRRERLARGAEAARKAIHSWEVIAQKTRDCYEAVLKGRSK